MLPNNKGYTIEIEVVPLSCDDERIVNFNEAMELLLPEKEVLGLIFKQNKRMKSKHEKRLDKEIEKPVVAVNI